MWSQAIFNFSVADVYCAVLYLEHTAFCCVFKAMVRDVETTIMMTRKFLSLFFERGGLWHGSRLSCPLPKAAFQRKRAFKRLCSSFATNKAEVGWWRWKQYKQFLSYFNVILFIVHRIQPCCWFAITERMCLQFSSAVSAISIKAFRTRQKGSAKSFSNYSSSVAFLRLFR